ncbi:hypothetical protein ACLOJK_010258 [Asimina triloba]
MSDPMFTSKSATQTHKTQECVLSKHQIRCSIALKGVGHDCLLQEPISPEQISFSMAATDDFCKSTVFDQAISGSKHQRRQCRI